MRQHYRRRAAGRAERGLSDVDHDTAPRGRRVRSVVRRVRRPHCRGRRHRGGPRQSARPGPRLARPHSRESGRLPLRAGEVEPQGGGRPSVRYRARLCLPGTADRARRHHSSAQLRRPSLRFGAAGRRPSPGRSGRRMGRRQAGDPRPLFETCHPPPGSGEGLPAISRSASARSPTSSRGTWGTTSKSWRRAIQHDVALNHLGRAAHRHSRGVQRSRFAFDQGNNPPGSGVLPYTRRTVSGGHGSSRSAGGNDGVRKLIC